MMLTMAGSLLPSRWILRRLKCQIIFSSLFILTVRSESDECTLYLAPSTIPNAGLGIFTSISRTAGDTIGEGDVMLPFVDMNFHNGDREYFNIWDDYLWDGATMGMHLESSDHDVDAYAPGLDCAINCHLALLNVDRGSPHFDDAGLHRSRDPGAGAFSLWINGSTIAMENIPAGGELFKFYGNNWFTTRPDTFGLIPLSHDWIDANELLQKFHNITRDLSQTIQQQIHSIITNFGYESRILNAIPKTFSDVAPAIEQGIRSIHQHNATRNNLHKLKQARCLDTIRGGPSTIPQAGRGAFATRSFAKDQVVTGSPLLHVPDRSILHTFDSVYDEEANDFTRTKLSGQQLVVNYCWGHPDSSLLLCPYSAGVNYINHNQTQANLMLQWAPDGHMAQSDKWFKSPLDKMMNLYRPLLGWDYVALRDINEGEELFINYGDEWEDAWQKHVDTWQTVPDDDYDPAIEWNRRLETAELRTTQEQTNDPYPENLEIRCHDNIRYSSFETEQYTMTFWELWGQEYVGLPCRIITRTTVDGNTVYAIDVKLGGGIIKRKSNVDRKMMAFRDKPYSTDVNLPNAFRQEAFIPENMFPKLWKNLLKHRSDEL